MLIVIPKITGSDVPFICKSVLMGSSSGKIGSLSLLHPAIVRHNIVDSIIFFIGIKIEIRQKEFFCNLMK